MFFFLSKTLGILIAPVPVIAAGLILTILLYRRTFSRTILLLVTAVFVVFSTPAAVNLLMKWIEMPPVTRSQLKRRYDAVVVLTGMVDLDADSGENREFLESVDRILAGVDFIRHDRARLLIISGGTGNIFNNSVKEASVLKQFALQYGIDEERILVESDSRNTYENAKNTAALIRRNDFSTILLVTSSFHMRRALACFRKQDLDPDIYPVDFRSSAIFQPTDLVPTAESLFQTGTVLREVVGYISYRIQGYL